LLLAVSVILLLQNVMNHTVIVEMLRRLQGERITQAVSDFEGQVRTGDLLPEELVTDVCDVKKIRYLTIGGHAAAANESYTNYLCDGDKIAGEHITPEGVYPCIDQMIGDNVYDVIVLDLFHEADESLLDLTRRLNHRFPEATIFDMRQFFPGDLGFKHRSGWVDIVTWAKQIGHSSMTQEFLDAFANSSRKWGVKKDEHLNYYIRNEDENNVWSIFKDAANKFEKIGDVWKETLLKRSWMYDDFFKSSIDNDKDVARGILDFSMYNATNTSRDDSTNPWDEDAGLCNDDSFLSQ